MLGGLAAALRSRNIRAAARQPSAGHAIGQQGPRPRPQIQPKVSKQASKALSDLQNAVNAKDTANIPALVAAAQAKVKTADDKFALAQFNSRPRSTPTTKPRSSPVCRPRSTRVSCRRRKRSRNISIWAGSVRQSLSIPPRPPRSSGSSRSIQATSTQPSCWPNRGTGRNAEAVSLIEEAIAAKTAAGQKADESWYKRAAALAFDAKLPCAELSRQWVAAYPTTKSWRDAIRIYQTSARVDDNALLDTMRLAQALVRVGRRNHYYFATLVTKGFAGEAKQVLSRVSRPRRSTRTVGLSASCTALRPAGLRVTRRRSTASAKTALAAASARQALVTGEAYYGYGEYAKAAELFRAALGKDGADKDLTNLRLGMALARAGDKAGAEAALKAVGGTRTAVAKLADLSGNQGLSQIRRLKGRSADGPRPFFPSILGWLTLAPVTDTARPQG